MCSDIRIRYKIKYLGGFLQLWRGQIKRIYKRHIDIQEERYLCAGVCCGRIR